MIKQAEEAVWMPSEQGWQVFDADGREIGFIAGTDRSGRRVSIRKSVALLVEIQDVCTSRANHFRVYGCFYPPDIPEYRATADVEVVELSELLVDYENHNAPLQNTALEIWKWFQRNAHRYWEGAQDKENLVLPPTICYLCQQEMEDIAAEAWERSSSD